MTKTMKNKACIMALVFIFIMGQIFTGAGRMVSAVENNFEVSVQVQSFDGVIITGKSSSENGFKALKEVLDKNNIPMVATDSKYGKFISEINEIKSGNFGGYDGWSYAINRNNSYQDISASIDATKLENGDKLILYYGDMGTLTANKIDYSTVDANVELTISLNNIAWDKSIKPITGIKAKIDGAEVVVVDNKITISEGLEEGKHTLELSDFRTDGSPKVVYDGLEFTIGKEVAADVNVNVNENIADKDVDNTTITKEISEAINSSVAVVNSKGLNTWSAMSLNKLGKKVDTTFLNESIQDIVDNGVKDISNTDMEKLIIGLTAAGYTPYNVKGYNLVSELFNRDINTFLINDAVFGIFAYKYANIKEKYSVTVEKLADIIMKSKLTYDTDANTMVGWTYYGEKVDPDMTGAAINALSGFYNTKPEVKESIDAAVKTMSILQNESGYSVSQYGLASETTSFVILGLTSVGINPEGDAFTKPKGDLVSALLSFKAVEGGFKHLIGEGSSNYTSTEQALRALISINEYKTSGKYDFYVSSINSKGLPAFALKSTKSNNEVKDPNVVSGINEDKSINEVKSINEDKIINEDKSINEVKTINEVGLDELPATGALIDTTLLIILGMLFMTIGALYLRKVKSEK